MRNEEDVLYGARKTLDELNKRLNASIKRNQGARCAAHVVNVFNDVVTNLHMMELDIAEREAEVKASDEEAVIIVFTNLGGVVE